MKQQPEEGKASVKKLSDYIHLYLGCDVLYKSEIHFLSGMSIPYKTNDKTIPTFSVRPDKKGFRSTIYSLENFDDIKLILRPLSDLMSHELNYLLKEKFTSYSYYEDFRIENESNTEPAAIYFKGFKKIHGNLNHIQCTQHISSLSPNQFKYLLSIEIDLFGLIESGLAIDKTKLNPHV